MTPKTSKYINMKWIPPTTNAVERLFSRLKIVFSDRRKNLLPRHLELILTIVANRNLWDIDDCTKIFNAQNTASQDEDDQLLDSEEEHHNNEEAEDIEDVVV
jgi:hypothetical protein